MGKKAAEIRKNAVESNSLKTILFYPLNSPFLPRVFRGYFTRFFPAFSRFFFHFFHVLCWFSYWYK
jgi:hypothetical protein